MNNYIQKDLQAKTKVKKIYMKHNQKKQRTPTTYNMQIPHFYIAQSKN